MPRGNSKQDLIEYLENNMTEEEVRNQLKKSGKNPGLEDSLPEMCKELSTLMLKKSGNSSWGRDDVLSTIVDMLDNETVFARLRKYRKNIRSAEISELRKDLVKLMKSNVDTTGMISRHGRNQDVKEGIEGESKFASVE